MEAKTINLTTNGAIALLVKKWETDKDYFYGWQSNIAMAFKDEFARRFPKDDDMPIHEVANTAAANFLNLLCAHKDATDPPADETRVTITPAEAVYSVMAWLTTREQPITLSKYHGAAIAAEIAARFCTVHGLADKDTVLDFANGVSMAEHDIDTPPNSEGVRIVEAERRRQVQDLGYTREHYRAHPELYLNEELARAAEMYVSPDTGVIDGEPTPEGWPWDAKYWNPTPADRVKMLAKAGALIAAEIDRLTDPANSVGYEAGDICYRNGCPAKIEEHTDENGACSCHISAPCSHCVNSRAYCHLCGWDGREEQIAG